MPLNNLTKTALTSTLALGLLCLAPVTQAHASGISDALPHMIWQYTFRDNSDRHNPRAERDYLTCTYIGPHGEITVHAENGRCPWLKRFGSNPEGAIRHRR